MRPVCGHANHRTTMVHTFLESPSNLDVHREICFGIFEKFRRKWRLKYTIWGPLRYVCGQTINPISMVCNALVVFYLCSDFEKLGRIDEQKCKISRLSFLVSRPWRDTFRHVCDHTNHHTTMFYTFLESLSNLNVHRRKRFALLRHYRRN